MDCIHLNFNFDVKGSTPAQILELKKQKFFQSEPISLPAAMVYSMHQLKI